MFRLHTLEVSHEGKHGWHRKCTPLPIPFSSIYDFSYLRAYMYTELNYGIKLIRGSMTGSNAKCKESLLWFPVPATPRYNQYQVVLFNFVQ